MEFEYYSCQNTLPLILCQPEVNVLIFINSLECDDNLLPELCSRLAIFSLIFYKLSITFLNLFNQPPTSWLLQSLIPTTGIDSASVFIFNNRYFVRYIDHESMITIYDHLNNLLVSRTKWSLLILINST
jgi:hypothetical protein